MKAFFHALSDLKGYCCAKLVRLVKNMKSTDLVKLESLSSNTVFALVRSKDAAGQLLEFVNSESNKNKNVTVLQADLADYKSIKVRVTQCRDLVVY